MMDSNSVPIDLCIKRKYDEIEQTKGSSKKKSRSHHGSEIPLDLSVKPSTNAVKAANSPIHHPSAIPFYDPTNLLLNSTTLLYDLFLANFNAYCQQRPNKIDCSNPNLSLHSHSAVPLMTNNKSSKSSSNNSSRSIKENSNNKSELYACSCGEKYSTVAQLVSHLKITNHHAQLSSTHDEVAKLVRGQDIWLSRDTNPANQILKCLRCSLSFETLPDLTAHMMKTNHFTQLIPSPSTSTSKSSTSNSSNSTSSLSSTKFLHSSSNRSTCLICSQQFARELELVDHIQHVHQIRYNCTTCGMYFENEQLYKDHVIKEMHHRNGKANRNRDYFLQQCKSLQKRPNANKSERIKVRSGIELDVEQVLSDLLDRLSKEDELPKAHDSALSLLQNFVIEQTPAKLSIQPDLNNNHFDREDISESSDGNKSPKNFRPISTENPLESLEKMLSYPSSTLNASPSMTNGHELRSSLNNHSIVSMKRKKFDKYRLFAEKMLRSTLS